MTDLQLLVEGTLMVKDPLLFVQKRSPNKYRFRRKEMEMEMDDNRWCTSFSLRNAQAKRIAVNVLIGATWEFCSYGGSNSSVENIFWYKPDSLKFCGIGSSDDSVCQDLFVQRHLWDEEDISCCYTFLLEEH